MLTAGPVADGWLCSPQSSVSRVLGLGLGPLLGRRVARCAQLLLWRPVQAAVGSSQSRRPSGAWTAGRRPGCWREFAVSWAVTLFLKASYGSQAGPEEELNCSFFKWRTCEYWCLKSWWGFISTGWPQGPHVLLLWVPL